MRDFNCYLLYFDKNDKLINLGRQACYSQLRNVILNSNGNLYIDTHYDVNTKDLELVCSLINEITPCFISHNSKILIDYPLVKYQLLNDYKKDLFLCNFIRYTWCDIVPGTSKIFFNTLHEKEDIKDPIERLTIANREANKIIEKYDQNFNHCNYGYAGRLAEVRSLSQFLKTNFVNISSFLT